jgi:D-xylose transport system substrate-binding protein
MKRVFRKSTAVLLVAAAATVAVAVATAGVTHKTAAVQVCVLLPDTKSSVRWEQFDRPSFAKALKAAGVTSTIVNAEGDAQKQISQANQCLANGAKVVIITSLDAGSSIAIQKAAAAKGAKSIDYDRLIVGGSGSVYVSFDGHAVGVLQGKGVVAGLKASGKYSAHPVVAELNGGPTDNNSFLFKGGYDSVLKPLYKNGTLKKGPDQFVPQWDNQKAETIFEQMLVKTGNKIDAVAAANDGLANAVVTALKNHGLKPLPLSGQDATSQGVQNIISGWQTMTVYKQVPKEANAAAKAAVELLKGTKLTSNGTVKNGKRNMPAVLIAPISINKSNYTLLFKEHFLKKSEVCVGTFAKFCK